MPEGFAKVTHCLFDMDGLLLNTEHIYTKITQQILEEQGCKEAYTGDFKVTLMGGQSLEVANAIVKRFNLSVSPEDYTKRQRQLALNLMPTAEILPGVERLLRHLASHKVPMALATSSSKEMYDLKTVRHTKLFELFDHKVYGSSDVEVKHGKPAPDIFIVAASRFKDKPDPSKCLVFEDAPNGVKAALAAGCPVVMVPEDYVTAEMRAQATLVVNTLEEFKPELFGLPAFD
ncbi:probable pseudouridine-5'-phosphatase [Sitodiplosis mosellana]|uniref:probable pseudouridine-5'-phosphatase n=1 Tax=Sitodiplosis mosellana TaxID=263140 RepID=UPI00244458A8|nr:probable pseudouridine-5'-phosphatase [Sitodiplosis mosellana]